jgi:hypothetical protein
MFSPLPALSTTKYLIMPAAVAVAGTISTTGIRAITLVSGRLLFRAATAFGWQTRQI